MKTPGSMTKMAEKLHEIIDDNKDTKQLKQISEKKKVKSKKLN